jgi:hypothetical protein
LQAVREGLERVTAIAAHERTPTDDEWSDLTGISLIFATFEAVYRSQGILPACLNELPTPPAGWRAWAQAICTEVEVEDLAVLGWAAASDHADLRDAEVLCNPTFEQSAALGGADADLITGEGCLIDLKSTSTTKVCSRADLWQICGYALADTGDALGITSVGISALRWRSRVSWTLTDLLSQLASEPVDLAAIRRDFADAAVGERRDQVSARTPVKPTVRSSRS